MISASHSPDHCVPSADGSCSICVDEAIPGVVENIHTESATAEVRTSTGTTTVAIDLLDEVVIGDTLMIHLGFAIGHLSQSPSETVASVGTGKEPT
ncbi:MAG: hypothetical protein NVSMB53_13550 [Gemmatimonadaceae bacterium]